MNLEFKEAAQDLPRGLFETICAFLNLDGGLIVLGVADAPGAGTPSFTEDDMFTTVVPLAPDTGAVTPQVTPQAAPQVTPQVVSILAAARKPSSFSALQDAVGLNDRVHFLKAYLDPLLAAGWIERTIPDKPGAVVRSIV